MSGGRLLFATLLASPSGRVIVDVDGRFGGGRPLDLRLWGKSGSLQDPYPLACHLLDTGAAAEVLWRDALPPSTTAAIARGLDASPEDAGRLVAFWAALHDIGKITPGFQAKVPEAFSRLAGYSVQGAQDDFRHDYGSHIFLGRVLGELGYAGGLAGGASATRVAQLLGGHHGCFHEMKARDFDIRIRLPKLGTAEWEEQRRAALDSMRAVFDPPSPPKKIGVDAAALACGLVILADWLVSQEDFLRGRLDEVPQSADLTALRRHRERTGELMAGLAADAGLGRPSPRAGSFAQEFPAFPPNALQRSVADGLPPLLSGPGLLLVMAPMGMGKTETALHAARLMGDAAGTAGMFVTLPTMATSDQMYGRVREYAERWVDGDAAVTLLHSMAWLNAAYADEPPGGDVVTGDGDRSDESRTAATAWLRGRKRGLLAPLSVGTVDQALLTVLPVRHNVLRMLGLAGKVLVVDEVHAYDAYMQYLLARLLTWLGTFGAPVVLLSATLPTPVAERLVRAYLSGARGPRFAMSVEAKLAYPGWVYVDAVSGAVTARTFDVSSRWLAVEMADIPAQAKEAVDRSAALKALLEPVFRDGGSVMIVCTTVAEAQDTFTTVAKWRTERTGLPAGSGDEIGDDEIGDDDAGDDEAGLRLTLLHARLPAREREKRTARVTAAFGRDGARRPKAAILVATQVAEQSLDLDFDLVVSDLAPVAQLLQRAGRCQRHPKIDKLGLRPGWAVAGGPRLAVLVPRGGGGELTLPERWTGVYDRSLLRRTHDVLVKRHPQAIDIPGDVQAMVEEVYDETFYAEIPDDELQRRMEDDVRHSIAEMTAVKAPGKLNDLEPLTKKEIVEDRVSTRLGAESVRVVCCFVDADGRRWLDRDRTVPLPVRGEGAKGRFTAGQVKTILGESIPLRDGDWRRRDRDVTAIPPAWRDNPTLQDLLLLPHPLAADGAVAPVEVGNRSFRLDPTLGLTG
jgi:CRISPR-associated endonuclease/helicase Cas3